MTGARRVPLVGVLVAGTATLFAASPAAGQLISPGKLAAPHAELEGIRNCTKCHQLGRRGVSRDLCLDCHTPLGARLSRDAGFHASLAEPDCASCHKDHFGVEFELVKLDTLAFDHDRTGHVLEGAHAQAGCRTCHTPSAVADPEVRRVKSERGGLDRTFLGLRTGCLDCHGGDDPHAGTFPGQDCTDCHGQVDWAGADGFDHADTPYPLTGRHRQVECTGCHVDLPPRAAGGRWGTGVELRFDGLAAGACTDCHAADDPHGGAMAGPCSSCHGTSGWRGVDRSRVESSFDHTTTGFDLIGAHGALACASCHDAAASGRLDGIALTFDPASRGHAFPRPASDRCMSCHVDRHEGLFDDRPGGAECAECHGVAEWLPADYDLTRHNAEAAFRLEGAHAVVPCVTCHETPDGALRFDVGVPDGCTTCHAVDDPHGEQFADRTCDSCHGIDAFAPVTVDHDATRYPLDGAHVDLDCASCHRAEPDGAGGTRIRYRPLGTECRDCHGGTP